MDVSSGIFAITIICRDLAGTTAFYRDALELPIHWQDDDSAVFLFGSTMVNLLALRAAPELIEPAAVADDPEGVRTVFTVHVADVDAAAASLTDRGVALLNGPMDRRWGPRTVSFRDPEGTVWELARD